MIWEFAFGVWSGVLMLWIFRDCFHALAMYALEI